MPLTSGMAGSCGNGFGVVNSAISGFTVKGLASVKGSIFGKPKMSLSSFGAISCVGITSDSDLGGPPLSGCTSDGSGGGVGLYSRTFSGLNNSDSTFGSISGANVGGTGARLTASLFTDGLERAPSASIRS